MKKYVSVSLLTLALVAPGFAQKGKGGGQNQNNNGQARIERQRERERERDDRARERQMKELERQENKNKTTIADRIHRNPQLEEKLRAMLPPGMNLRQASAGFKNQGQFIAALNASKNLNIPFSQLKSRMTGTHPESLGQAIQQLRPDIDKKRIHDEVERAEKESKEIEKHRERTT